RASESLADRVEVALADTFALHQAEGPLGDLGAAGMPFVREREHDEAREPELEGRARLPREEFGLMLLALADGVHPGFAEHQRPFARRRHQMRQVAAEVGFAMQIDVEADEIEEA